MAAQVYVLRAANFPSGTTAASVESSQWPLVYCKVVQELPTVTLELGLPSHDAAVRLIVACNGQEARAFGRQIKVYTYESDGHDSSGTGSVPTAANIGIDSGNAYPQHGREANTSSSIPAFVEQHGRISLTPTAGVLVRNLPRGASSDELRHFFGNLASVIRADILLEARNSGSAVGGVLFTSVGDAMRAMQLHEAQGTRCNCNLLQLSYFNFNALQQQAPRVKLLDLPQELLDIIFSFAYQRLPWLCYIDRRQWDEQEKDRRRASSGPHELRPFRPKVNEFLVSKKFFVGAASAWIGNQTIGMRMDVAFCLIARWRDRGIQSAFVTKLRSDWWDAGVLASLPRLRHLELTVKPSQFDVVEPRFAWEYELSVQEFEAVEGNTGLSQLRGLKALRLLPGLCKWTNDSTKVATWARNVQRYEELLQSLVTQPRNEDISRRALSIRKSGRLYAGSEVRYNG